MANSDGLSTSSTGRSPSSSHTRSDMQSELERHQGFTHVFCPVQSRPSKSSHSLKPDLKALPSHSQAGKHYDINTTTTFHRGLDWLLTTTKEMERRHQQKTSSRETPLTEDSLRAFISSEQGAVGSSWNFSNSTQTSSKGHLRD